MSVLFIFVGDFIFCLIYTCPKETKIRLANGPTPSRGRVEIMYRGEWGTICRDSFGQDEAKVVCRMLGYHNT